MWKTSYHTVILIYYRSRISYCQMNITHTNIWCHAKIVTHMNGKMLTYVIGSLCMERRVSVLIGLEHPSIEHWGGGLSAGTVVNFDLRKHSCKNKRYALCGILATSNSVKTLLCRNLLTMNSVYWALVSQILTWDKNEINWSSIELERYNQQPQTGCTM